MRYIQSILEIHVNTLIGKFICQKKKISYKHIYVLYFNFRDKND